MARTDTLSNYLTDIATAIKEKKQDDSPIIASNFDEEIRNLSTESNTVLGYKPDYEDHIAYGVDFPDPDSQYKYFIQVDTTPEESPLAFVLANGEVNNALKIIDGAEMIRTDFPQNASPFSNIRNNYFKMIIEGKEYRVFQNQGTVSTYRPFMYDCYEPNEQEVYCSSNKVYSNIYDPESGYDYPSMNVGAGVIKIRTGQQYAYIHTYDPDTKKFKLLLRVSLTAVGSTPRTLAVLPINTWNENSFVIDGTKLYIKEDLELLFLFQSGSTEKTFYLYKAVIKAGMGTYGTDPDKYYSVGASVNLNYDYWEWVQDFDSSFASVNEYVVYNVNDCGNYWLLSYLKNKDHPTGSTESLPMSVIDKETKQLTIIENTEGITDRIITQDGQVFFVKEDGIYKINYETKSLEFMLVANIMQFLDNSIIPIHITENYVDYFVYRYFNLPYDMIPAEYQNYNYLYREDSSVCYILRLPTMPMRIDIEPVQSIQFYNIYGKYSEDNVTLIMDPENSYEYANFVINKDGDIVPVYAPYDPEYARNVSCVYKGVPAKVWVRVGPSSWQILSR